MTAAQLTLVGKPGCHLCDDAREVVVSVLAEVAGTTDAIAVTFSEVSILDDPALNDLYVEEIPVVLINGKIHNYWRIDPVRLRTALLELT